MTKVLAHDLHHTIREHAGGNVEVSVEWDDEPTAYGYGTRKEPAGRVYQAARRFVRENMPSGWEVCAFIGIEHYKLDGYSVTARRYSVVRVNS